MTAEAPFALLCSLENIDEPERDRSTQSRKLHLGLNLIPALCAPAEKDDRWGQDAATDKETNLVQPWLWLPRTLELRAFLQKRIDGVAGAVRVESVETVHRPTVLPSPADDGLEPMKTSLAPPERTKRRQLAWRTRVDSTDEAPRDAADDRNWPLLLGEMSQLPWPLPQALRLTHRMHLVLEPQEQGMIEVEDYRLVVAPVLPPGLQGPLPLKPAPFPELRGLRPVLAYFPDEEDHGSEAGSNGGGDASEGESGDTAPPVPLAFAFCKGLNPFREPSPSVFLPKADSASNGGWSLRPFHEDWRTHFENRIRASLKLGPDLLQAIRKGGATTSIAEKLIRNHLSSFSKDLLPPNLPQDDQEKLLQVLSLACECAYGDAREPLPQELVHELREKLRSQLRDGKEVRRSLQRGYEDFLRSHLGVGNGGDEWLQNWIADTAKQNAQWLYPEPADDSAVTEKGDQQTDGVTLQIAPFAAAPDDDEEDRLAEIRGVVVLAREKDGEWHCLNWARAVDPGRARPLLEDPLLLPARLAWVGGLHQATVTYDNAPLAVRGPLESLGAWELRSINGGGTSSLPICFGFHPETRLPGLAFGRDYELAAFLVGNSGALPSQVRENGSPWKMAQDPSRWRIPEGVTFKYRRQVPVGLARAEGPFLVADGERQVPGRLGAPDGVTPRMGEVVPRLAAVGNGAQENGAAGGGADRLELAEESRPFLLLHRDLGSGSAQPTCRFEIRPPAVDWRTWDRWMAADGEGAVPLRQEVLARFHEIRYCIDSEAAPDDQLRETARELVLDDPAVRGFRVVVRDLDQDEEVLEGTLGFGAHGDDGEHRLPGRVRRRPSTLALSGCVPHDHPPRAYRPSAGSDGLHLELSEGHLYRVTVYPLLVDGAGYRFHERAEDEPALGEVAIWEVDVEVAEPFFETAELPGVQADLGRYLHPSVEGGLLRVDLDLEGDGNGRPAAPERLRRHVSKARLLRQAWAWDGRPVPVHPKLAEAFDQPAPCAGGEDIGCWETLTMGHRDDSGHGLYPLRRQEPEGTGDEQRLPRRWTWEEDLGYGPEAPDPGASHHRFSVRVHSRYAGLYRRGGGSLEATRSKDDRGLAWRSAFVPCRWSGEVPAPRVRAVLPLTRNRHPEEDDPGRSRPFLVILEEGWHQVGGLAERLEVEPVKWVPADPSPQAAPERVVGGPDPIVSTDADTAVPELEVWGAIGHSREIDTALPRISATSFVVYARHPEGKPLDWWFLQVCFRRQVYVDGEWARSEATRPFWIQFLPAFDLDRFGRRPARAEWNGSTADVKPQKGESARKAVDDSGRIVPYLLLSRRIIDILGRPGEVVLGLLYPKRASPSADDLGFEPEADLAKQIMDLPDLQARLLEVQQDDGSKRHCTAQALWQALFPPPNRPGGDGAKVANVDPRWDRADGQARIVGISDPFPFETVTAQDNALAQKAIPCAATDPVEVP